MSKAKKKRKRAATTLPKAKGAKRTSAPSVVTCRHPLTDIAAAVRSLWEYDRVMANPESQAAARQAGNAFDVTVAVLRREIERLSEMRKTKAYTTVQ